LGPAGASTQRRPGAAASIGGRRTHAAYPESPARSTVRARGSIGFACSSRRDAKYQQLLAHAEERVFESVNEAVEAILAGSGRAGRVPPDPAGARVHACARASERACARVRACMRACVRGLRTHISAAQSLDRSP
jgi:hypothetical protein